jgi:hypothetical protein
MDKWDTGIFVSKFLLNAFQLRKAQGWKIGRDMAQLTNHNRDLTPRIYSE